MENTNKLEFLLQIDVIVLVKPLIYSSDKMTRFVFAALKLLKALSV